KKDKWEQVVLPMFHHCILSSKSPMSFKRDQQLVILVQEVMDMVYPGNNYKAKLHGDATFDTLYDHMCETQNQIGKKAFSVIDEFFKNDDKLCDDLEGRLA
ncbi:hypothetical protein Moror_513, partial [Moniliophthora roreri MCA 2997]